MVKILDGIKSIEDFSLEGKKVFLRLDLNVPLDKQGHISDDTRIRAALPTIRYALEKGAKLVLASHLGRPKGEEDRQKLSLDPVAERLGELLNVDVVLVEDVAGEAPKALLAGLKREQLILLENLRFEEGEEKNDSGLAHRLAAYIDIYINDAFGASHRAHMSISALPALIEKRGMGFLMKKEIEMLEKVRATAERPYLTVLGGAKVSDKIKVIETLIDKVDGFLVGGAMAYTFLKALQVPVGKSLVEADSLRFASSLMERMEARGKNFLLPVDHVVTTSLDEGAEVRVTADRRIEEGWMGVDIGPKTRELFAEALKGAKTVFWNGPMGIFETPAFAAGSFAVAQALAESSALTIVGGGDSAAAAQASGYAEKMGHISTGGGASLEFIEGRRLPGLDALRPPKTSDQPSEPWTGGSEA